MSARLLSSLLKATAAKGFATSAFAHAGAVAMLAGISWSSLDQRSVFVGQREVISIQSSWAEPQSASDAVSVEVEPQAEPVLITPTTAEFEKHTYREAPTSAVTFAIAEVAVEMNSEVRPQTEIAITKQAAETSPPVVDKTTPQKPLDRKPAQARATSLSSLVAPPPQPIGNEPFAAPSFAGNRPPNYPEIARRNGWEGVVLLELHIDAAGKVVEVSVLQSSGYAVLDAEAVQAIRAWQGQPARRGTTAVPTVERLPVRFRL